MAELPELTQQNVGEIVGTKTKLYQPDGPRIPGDPRYENKPSNATPVAMRALLDELSAYTESVQVAQREEGMAKDVVQQQWRNDMAHWQYRLAHYYEVLGLVPADQANTLAGADAIYFHVTAPLLDGVFYEVLPGVVLNAEEKDRMQLGPPEGFSNRKPPDLYVPFSLGNQVLIYRQHQRERWDQLWADLARGVSTLGGLVPPGDPWGVVKHVAFTAAGALIGGLGAYIGVVVHAHRRQRQTIEALTR